MLMISNNFHLDQAWNQLSRLQRNLVYLLLMISLLACFWNYTRLKSHTKIEEGLSLDSDASHQSNIDKLINVRTKDLDEEVIIRNYANSYDRLFSCFYYYE